MPILCARDVLGHLLLPGDRVAVPVNPDAIPAERLWRAGAVLGFSPWKLEREALILFYPPGDGGSIRAQTASCWRLGSREEISWMSCS